MMVCPTIMDNEVGGINTCSGQGACGQGATVTVGAVLHHGLSAAAQPLGHDRHITSGAAA